MYDYGGPVESAPAVYVDYWGWTYDPSGEAGYLNRFLSSVGGTPWLNTVTQYGSGNPSVLFVGSWYDPSPTPAQPTDAQVQIEAANAARHFGLGTSVNVEVVVATPTGHSAAGFVTNTPGGYCAYHGAVASYPNITYTNLPYITDAGANCGAYLVNGNGSLDGVSIVEGHELAETITDPLLNAWYDASGNEIGDKCAWSNLADITTSGGTFAVQPLWSNRDNGCVTSYSQNRPVDHVVLSPWSATVTGATSQPYTATAFDAYGNSLGDVTAATTLAITPNGTGTGAWCNNTAHTCTATQAGTYTVTGAYSGKIGSATLTEVTAPTTPSLVGLTPARVMDTRSDVGAWGPVAQGGTVSLPVLGAGGVPTTGVSAVALNVTVTDTTAPGYVTVYPDGVSQPLASNLNFVAGQTVPNSVIAPVGADGNVDFYNGSSNTVQLVADVSGYFPTGTFGPLTPARIMDTRSDMGAWGPVAPGGMVSLPVLGQGGVPTTGVSAVVLNVTVTNTTAPGYVTVYPDGVSQPLASNLNFSPGQTVPNLVIAPVGADGNVDFYNGSGGTVQLVADASGYLPTGMFGPLTPARIIDTRSDMGAWGPVAPGGMVSLPVLGQGGVPTTGVSAVVLNVTVTNTTAPGYITVYPDGVSQPLASNLNFSPGQTVPNLVIAPVGADGNVDFYNGSGGTVQLVGDVSGYFG
jgi:hypothetical protein